MEFSSLTIDELDNERRLSWPANLQQRARRQCENYLREGLSPRTLVGFEQGIVRGFVSYPIQHSPVISCSWPVADSQEVVQKIARGLVHAIRLDQPAAIVTILEDPISQAHARCDQLSGFERLTSICRYDLDLSALGTLGDELQRACSVRAVSLDDSQTKPLLERTMVGSLDCPELHPFLTWDDRLDELRQLRADQFLVESSVMEDENNPLGIAISTTDLKSSQWQLSYLGILPEARGQHFGRSLLQHLLSRNLAGGNTRISVNVDRRNHYARRVYESLRFSISEEYPYWISDWEELL